ncbi:MAG: hypothetical protein Q3962_02785 [Corynebacterium sp.]|nr:hypothetical protein [Corynebacterium sp.]
MVIASTMSHSTAMADETAMTNANSSIPTPAEIAARFPFTPDSDTSTVEDTAQVSARMVDEIGYTPQLEYVPSLSSEFNAPLDQDSSFKTWLKRGPSQAYPNNGSWWRPEQYTELNGVFRDTMLRYCMPQGQVTNEDFDKYAPTEDACPSDKQTVYTTTRFEMPAIPAKNFKVVVRAYYGSTLPVNGLRRNMWLQAANKNSADPKYTEFDMSEHYSERPGIQYSCTHLAHFPDNSRYSICRQSNYADDGILNGWHTWSIEVFNGTVAYYFDNDLVGGDVVSKAKVDPSRQDALNVYDSLFNQNFRFVHDTMIETSHSPWLKQTDNTAPWGKQWVDFDYIRTYIEKPGTEHPAAANKPDTGARKPTPTSSGSSAPSWLLILLGILSLGGLAAGIYQLLPANLQIHR